MIEYFKIQFKSNPLLYRIWFFTYRRSVSRKIRWFDIDPVMYIDGYPRSGNTYSAFLIRTIWPNLPFVHHFHVKATLKIALKKDIPIFILVRDPANAISSNYLKYYTSRSRDIEKMEQINRQKLSELCTNYIKYYEFVGEQNQEKLEVIDFFDLIRDPFHMIQRINNALPVEYRVADETDLAARIEEVSKKKFGAKDTFGASLPNERKEAAKRKLIGQLEAFPHYQQALDVYEKVKDWAVSRQV